MGQACTTAGRPQCQRVGEAAVAEEERRRGIGRMLVKAAAQAARHAGCGRLEVLAGAGAPSLRGFCLATGFTEAGPLLTRSLRKQG